MVTARASRPPYWLVATLVPVVGIAAGLFGTATIARALNECDIGINAAANSFGLVYVVLPVLTIVAAAVFWAVFRFGYSSATRAFPPTSRWSIAGTGILAFLAALMALTLVLWAAMAIGIPEDYRSTCPGNTPPWWPAWLPL